MKCISSFKTLILVCTILISTCLSACGKDNLTMKYESEASLSAYSIIPGREGRAQAFSTNICVVEKDVTNSADEIEQADSYESAALFDLKDNNVIYAKNVYEQLYPASMTKVMTALVAMKYGQKEDMITCSENVRITESGAQLCGLKPGDRISMDTAMHALLMYSANDAAVAIAEHISGSVPEFAKLMNEEARRAGATHTNFVNPHGLHNEEHYTTAYDMYLMFNAAVKNDWFREIINKDSYSGTYRDEEGNTKELTFNTTNLYLKGDVQAPDGVTVIGGKTGTTAAAGNNLVMLSQDNLGNPYISIVMRSRERQLLYTKMTSLLNAIP